MKQSFGIMLFFRYNKKMIIRIRDNQTLWSALKENGIELDRPCAGNGTCGQCRVLIEGLGLVKSCSFDRPGAYNVIVPQQVDFDSIMEHTFSDHMEGKINWDSQDNWDSQPVAAIDVGTTTVALRVFHQGQYFEKGFVNPQRSYGADVMTRIRRANEGDAQIMKELLWQQLQNYGLDEDFSGRLIVSANTTMQHIMSGLSCQGLGQAPFSPVDISLREEEVGNMAITYLPGISTYVGADIVSGLYSLDILHRDKPILLIDLGTNGEMAIGCKDRIVVTSAAAGPAFEGSELAMRLHGSGIIKLISHMLHQGIIDQYGTLSDQYFETGYPTAAGMNIRQDNIRDIQMAKAAIRAGVELLLMCYGIRAEELEQVYLAGGMGYYLDPQHALDIGLLPTGIGSIRAIGNSSLAGAQKYAMTGDKQSLIDIVSRSEEIVLADQVEFEDLYVEHMNFNN